MWGLFGMSGGDRRVRATCWLLDAPDSLASQSRREPDGTGLEPGELVHVGPTLVIEPSLVRDGPPARPLTLADLHPCVAAAQAPPPAH